MTDGFVADWARYHASTRPEKVATIDRATDRLRTYAQLHERVGRVAGMLIDAGVKPGDRVGVLSPNTTDLLDILLATWRIGAIHLALNFRLTPAELEGILEDADPRIVFHDPAFAPIAKELGEHCEWRELGLGDAASDFEKQINSARVLNEPASSALDDPCMLMFSSGTTGRPKGVVITHAIVLGTLINGATSLGLDQNAVSYAAVPLFHIAGMMGFSIPALFAGGTAILEREFIPDRVFDAIEDTDLGVTHLIFVPAMWAGLRLHPRARTTDYSRLQLTMGGGSSVPPPLIHWWAQVGVTIQEVWGMTETCGGHTVMQEQHVATHAGSAGKTMMVCDVRVVDGAFNEVPTGANGELLVRGPNVLRNYWNRPDADKEAFVDGWFRTGDIASIDADGFVTIHDRLKDMYISGGENVYPAEVEAVLFQIEAVAEVAVVGIDDEEWGETGCAFIVIKSGQELTEAEVARHCEGRLARFKHPRKVLFVDAIPRNATGKILKYQLRESLA